jgi:hypothetical protein
MFAVIFAIFGGVCAGLGAGLKLLIHSDKDNRRFLDFLGLFILVFCAVLILVWIKLGENWYSLGIFALAVPIYGLIWLDKGAEQGKVIPPRFSEILVMLGGILALAAPILGALGI